MTPALFPLIIAIAVALVFGAIIGFRRAVPMPSRDYMDPLPIWVRFVWPLILFFSHYFGRLCSVESLERTQRQLVRGGMSYCLRAEQFVALRVVTSLLSALCAFLILRVLDTDATAGSLIALGFGYFAPQSKLTEARKRRECDIARVLPTYLDFITMAVEAGLSLSSALMQATSNGPRGLLNQELERVTRDITAGAGRVEALQAMAVRLEIPELSGVVSAIAQAERSGGSIGSTLRVQAEQQRVTRFQRAEKLAMEAPVKLIFPLVFFIFPTTFIVLGFPIAMKMLHQA